MALPASGAISFNDINVELGLSGTATISLNDTAVRTLFGISSGAIDMNTGHGRANAFSLTISSNQVQASLSSLASGAGWNGSTKLNATINSGVYIYSNSTGTPALDISGSYPSGVILTNNGVILGAGGSGGAGIGCAQNRVFSPPPGSPGDSGGVALSVSSAVTIVNNGTVAGGGGGGGGGGSNYNLPNRGARFGNSFYMCGGGGGGGGVGTSSGAGGGAGNIFGNGGASGSTGSDGNISGAGPGGPGGAPYGGPGGSGGGYGSGGGSGSAASSSGNGINYLTAGGGGGGAGAATSGNGNITWSVTGNRYGALN
jgi:hypothetical protein